MKPCAFFLEGRCMSGDACCFSHDVGPLSRSAGAAQAQSGSVGPAPEAPHSNHAQQTRASIPCTFYQAGACRKGDKCQSTHCSPQAPPCAQPYVEAPTAANFTKKTGDSRSLIPCKFYLRGSCRSGSECPHAHPERAVEKAEPTEEIDYDQERDSFYRTLFGAAVRFHDGARVSKVALHGDLSSVRIDSLPRNSSDIAISTLINCSSELSSKTASKSCEKELRHAAVKDLINAEKTASRTIELKPHQFSWACNGGFHLITAELGSHVASCDIVSKPKKIIITGSQKQYQTALDILERKLDKKQPTEKTNQEGDCAVCWTEAETPILTLCNHLYCSECFEGLCMAGVTGDKDSAISCAGDMGKCGHVLTMTELQERLSSSALEETLEASFTSHIRHHPDAYRHCPSPDCGSIYRVTSHASFPTCSKCLEPICAACHQRHNKNMTCTEYKYLTSGGHAAFEKYKREKGIKDCPKCSTPMEKTFGCNHMTCGGCGTHICWVCLRTFEDSGLCYAHMNQAHGGIGVDYFPDLV